MKKVVQYFDDLIDSMPVNKCTKQVRMDILSEAKKDFDTLINQGYTKKDARKQVIKNLPDPTEFNQYIPNMHSVLYYVLILIVAFAGIWGLQVMSNPDFLQFFKPTILEFPDILETLAQYTFVACATYFVCDLVYPLLPQKLLNRHKVVEAIILYSGITLYALYFCIAMAFCWFTFNGYIESELLAYPFATFMLNFYKNYILNHSNMILIGIITGLLLVSYKQRYHLNFKAEPYVEGSVYHPFTLNEDNTDLQDIEDISTDETLDDVVEKIEDEIEENDELEDIKEDIEEKVEELEDTKDEVEQELKDVSNELENILEDLQENKEDTLDEIEDDFDDLTDENQEEIVDELQDEEIQIIENENDVEELEKLDGLTTETNEEITLDSLEENIKTEEDEIEEIDKFLEETFSE